MKKILKENLQRKKAKGTCTNYKSKFKYRIGKKTKKKEKILKRLTKLNVLKASVEIYHLIKRKLKKTTTD